MLAAYTELMDTTIQIRIDKKTKDAAKKSLQSMGLTLSSGLKLFMTEVARTSTIPFIVTSADTLPEKEKHTIVRETSQALRKGKRYSTAKNLHRAIS